MILRNTLIGILMPIFFLSNMGCELAQSTLVNPVEQKKSKDFLDDRVFITQNVPITENWTNIPFENQYSSFRLSFYVKALEAASDVVIGLSNREVSAYTHLAPILRFNVDGKIDVRNGGAYQAIAHLIYNIGSLYKVDMDIHVGEDLNIYSVRIFSDPTADESILLAQNYAFRSENSQLLHLGNLATIASVGSAELSQVSIKKIESPKEVRHLLKISKEGKGFGSVSGQGFQCGDICQMDVVEGETISLNAVASSGSVFQSWSGACVGAQNPCSVSMSEAKNVTATFELLVESDDLVSLDPVIPPVTPVGLCHSISRHGITWTFNRAYTCGQYANGDYWVVGPLTITNISPRPIEGQNGTMINPALGKNQGFDKDLQYQTYVSNLNVGKSLPLNVPNNSSVVSSITVDRWTQFNTIRQFAVLTVVQNQPSPGSFRPPAIGGGVKQSHWNESQINYSKLKSLPREGLSVPNVNDMADYFSRLWLEFDLTWTGRFVQPWYMATHLDGSGNPATSSYGRRIANRTNNAILMLNLDFSNQQKRDLLVGVIQVAIDNLGVINSGGRWFSDGGHNLGRLAPMVVAASVLNEPMFKNAIKGSNYFFQEFRQTFIVKQSDVDITNRIATNKDQMILYKTSDIGNPEWGIRYYEDPRRANASIGASYRDINGGAMTGLTMGARCLGMKSLMGHEALFGYAERHRQLEVAGYPGGTNSNPTPAFHRDFYNKFKDLCP
jgi:hypothetical protein